MSKITDYFPKKPGLTARQVAAWKGLTQLGGKTTADVVRQQTVSVVRPGMTQGERQALQGLWQLGKTTPRQVVVRTLVRTHGKDGWTRMTEDRKETLVRTELTRRQRENEKRFMDKLKTLRRIRETRLKRDLDSLRDSPVRLASTARPTITVQELGERLRKLRQKNTPTPPKDSGKPKKGTRHTRHSVWNEKFDHFHKELEAKLGRHRKKLEKTGRFTPEEVQLGLQRMETDALVQFYDAVLTGLDEELFATRLSKILGITKGGLEKRYEIFLRQGHLPEIVSKKRKRPTTTKRKKPTLQDSSSSSSSDDDGDVPQPVRKRPVAL
jgi:hypothetical protein